jgi:hypothetical protein
MKDDLKIATDQSGVLWIIETDKNNKVVSISAYDKTDEIIVLFAEFAKNGKAKRVLMHASRVSG